MATSIPKAGARYVPMLTIMASLLHLGVAVVLSPSWGSIGRGGVWNTVSHTDYPAMTTLWFAVSGVGLLGLGLLSRRAVATTRALPVETGWLLASMGAFISILEPVSGGWLVLGIGLFAILSNRSVGEIREVMVSSMRASETTSR